MNASYSLCKYFKRKIVYFSIISLKFSTSLLYKGLSVISAIAMDWTENMYFTDKSSYRSLQKQWYIFVLY